MRWKTVRSRRPYYSSIIIHSSLPWMNFENRERIVLTIYSQPIYRHCSREKKWDSRTISSCFFTFRFFLQQQNQFRFSISNRVRWVVGILTWRNIFFSWLCHQNEYHEGNFLYFSWNFQNLILQSQFSAIKSNLGS